MEKIILATSSPYRQEAFANLDIPFEVEGSGVDETILERNNPEELVKELAKMKAEAVAQRHQKGIVIGFDSVAYFSGEILEKPESREEAFNRLKKLSGQDHAYYTGVHMIDITAGRVLSDVSKTDISMREISEKEINKYLDSDDRYTTFALGYDASGKYSASFIGKASGNYYGLLAGIPLDIIVSMLKEINHDS